MDPRASQVPLQILPMPLQSIAAIVLVDAVFVYQLIGMIFGRGALNEFLLLALALLFNDTSNIEKLPTRMCQSWGLHHGNSDLLRSCSTSPNELSTAADTSCRNNKGNDEGKNWGHHLS